MILKMDLSNQERLELISNMITEAKSHIARGGGSTQILMWGWVIAIANIAHFTLEQIGFYAPYVVWLVTIPAGFVSVYLGIRQSKQGVIGHLDRMYGQVWLAVGVSIVITLLLMGQLGFYHNPIILAEAGVGMFITGQLLRYKPVIIGATLLWFAALVEWQVDLQWHYLISAIAVFVGYLIPGYMLNRSERA
jgi:hypothetical protein